MNTCNYSQEKLMSDIGNPDTLIFACEPMEKYIVNSYLLPEFNFQKLSISLFEQFAQSAGILRGQHVVLYDSDGTTAQKYWMLFILFGHPEDSISVLAGGLSQWEYGTQDLPQKSAIASRYSYSSEVRKHIIMQTRDLLFFYQQERCLNEEQILAFERFSTPNGECSDRHFDYVIDCRQHPKFELPLSNPISGREFVNERAYFIKSGTFGRVDFSKGCLFVGASVEEIAPVLFAAYCCSGDLNSLYVITENIEVELEQVLKRI